MKNTEEQTAPRLLGVLGWPIAHSLSPAMHNAAFRALGLNWVYTTLAVPPPQLEDAVRGLRALDFVGANVTVPHKQAVLAHLDALTPVAQAMGAANTIFREGDRLVGDNTDGAGFLADLRAHNVEPTGQTCLVIGGGGAARAVAYALASAGASLFIVNRTVGNAHAIAALVQANFPHASVQCGQFPTDLAAFAAQASLIVNATSIGMWPNVNETPWVETVAFRPTQAVYDLVYTPRETALLRQAASAGARTIDGLGMLVEQGAAALARWSGQQPPVDVMRAAATAALEKRDAH